MTKWYQNGSGLNDPTAAAVLSEERAVAESRTHMISDERLARMTLEEIKPRICGKFGGDILKCVDCPVACRYGRRVSEIMDAKTKPTDPEDKICGVELLKMSVQEKTRIAEKKYKHAIESGDPVAYLTDCGMPEKKAKDFLQRQESKGQKKAVTVNINGMGELIAQMKKKSSELTEEAIRINDQIKKLEEQKAKISEQVNALNEAIKTMRKAGEML